VGDPLKTMFRTEASVQTSPETIVEDSTIPPHRKTVRLQAVGELLLNSFLFSYQYQNITLGAINMETDDQTVINHRYGLGFKAGKFTFGLYGGRGTQTVGKKELKTDLYQGTLSFTFI